MCGVAVRDCDAVKYLILQSLLEFVLCMLKKICVNLAFVLEFCCSFVLSVCIC